MDREVGCLLDDHEERVTAHLEEGAARVAEAALVTHSPGERDPAVDVANQVPTPLRTAVVGCRDDDRGRWLALLRVGLIDRRDRLEHTTLTTRRAPRTPGRTFFAELHDFPLSLRTLLFPSVTIQSR